MEDNSTLKQLINEMVNNGIVEAFGNAVSIQDTDYRIRYQNKKAISIIGSHTGKFCYEAFEKRDYICEGCPLALSFRDGKVRTVERRNPVKNELFVEITTSVIRDSRGKIIAGIEIVRDISKQKRLEEKREKLLRELKAAVPSGKRLKGFLPVCSYCNKVRDSHNNWTPFEVYIRDHSEAEITHGYCPECVSKQFSTDDKTVY